ncbi:MAG: hypothetical protein ACTIKR_11520 [Advenella sp.]|uniref:Uncharacterized protein n=1 Tax=Advenella kashmirensis TaxID=310575 RepID=A0A356LIT6_9BURK|nr:hypothetical protein [Advenella sp. FME57]HBP30920.1 hypothetical protein [Advenella kashmirensis]
MSPQFPHMPLPQGLTYEFLGTFARSEYALKCAGFARGNASTVEANWDEFSKAIDWHFRRVSDTELKDAVNFLLTDPPRKQILKEGSVIWKDSPPAKGLLKTQKTLLMVRRIRNNLFHGAKIWSPEYRNIDRDRDIRLVQAGLTVLKRCILINQKVRVSFEHGAF